MEAEARAPRTDGQGAQSMGVAPADALVLFLLLLGFYHVNGALLLSNDINGNIGVALSVVNDGDLSFTPEEAPSLFHWEITGQAGWEPVYFHSWDQSVRGNPARELRDAGQLRFVGPQYFVIPSQREGTYVNHAIGPGLTAVPFFAIVQAAKGDLRTQPMLSFYVGKFAAATAVAGSAVFLFLIASMYLPRNSALLVAMTYGLATGVWTSSSQALWSHGPTSLYVAMGCYFLLRSRQSVGSAIGCGLAAALAVLCDPTSVVFAGVAAVVLFRTAPRRLAQAAIAGLAVAALQAIYNQIHLGAFWAFASPIDMSEVAAMKTGSPAVWRANVFAGAAGLLASPSRGLLVYSPVLGFALVGVVQAWRDDRYEALRPFSVAFGLTAIIAFAWFDWWGGWSYGYRPLVDSLIYLSIFFIPVLGWLWERRVLTALFFVTLAWSFFVQGLGAFAATGYGWNAANTYEFERDGHRVVVTTQREAEAMQSRGGVLVSERRCDIDLPDCRYRLWSLSDNQIGFHWRNYDTERNRKRYQSSFSRLW